MRPAVEPIITVVYLFFGSQIVKTWSIDFEYDL
jgi:hypothetical protein